MLTLADLKQDEEIQIYIEAADRHLGAMGFTEHGRRHADLVSSLARRVLVQLGHPRRRAELAAIAGYLHDIGNMISRQDHGQTGAGITWRLLKERGMHPAEIAPVVGAIGNHEEQYGHAVDPVAAALVLADKSDVHRSRVRSARPDVRQDIHDRVNFAVEKHQLTVDPDRRVITLTLTIDTEISPVMDYFEIFLKRMLMCRRAAEVLEANFELEINGHRLL